MIPVADSQRPGPGPRTPQDYISVIKKSRYSDVISTRLLSVHDLYPFLKLVLQGDKTSAVIPNSLCSFSSYRPFKFAKILVEVCCISSPHLATHSGIPQQIGSSKQLEIPKIILLASRNQNGYSLLCFTLSCSNKTNWMDQI